MHYHTKQGETVAVQNLNFSVSEGQFAAVIGPSGCGKTTLLSLAAGLLKPTEGEVKNSGVRFGYMLQKTSSSPGAPSKKISSFPSKFNAPTPPNTAPALSRSPKNTGSKISSKAIPPLCRAA